MRDWNVVVSIHERGMRQAFAVLREFGPVKKAPFFNILTMNVRNSEQMMEALRNRTLEDPLSLSFLSRLIPLTHTFSFQSPEDFEQKSKEVILSWVPALAGKAFHVRMHRRGFKGRLSSLDEEHLLDNTLLEALKEAAAPGRITFDNPDVIIAVETVAQRAGLSFWTRELLQRYPFVRLD